MRTASGPIEFSEKVLTQDFDAYFTESSGAMMRRTRAATACIAVALSWIGASSFGGPAFAAQSPDLVSASVPPGSQADPHGSFYLLHAHGGDTVRQTVTVQNPNDRSILADVAGVDASTGASTGATYATPGSVAKGTGAWIDVAEHELQLSASERRTVSFGVRVPAGIAPGQYLAGLSIAVPRDRNIVKPQPGQNQAGFAVSLQAQRIIAVEVDIAGPQAPELVVSGVGPAANGDMVDLLVGIANRGNAFARGNGVVTVADTGFRHEFDIATFVPHTGISMSVPWTRLAVAGDHNVEVLLTYGNGLRTRWSGVVHIDDVMRSRLNGQLRSSPTRADTHSGMPGSIALGGGAAGIALCSALAFRVRRRRHPFEIGARGSG